ncbi:hypothetical protein CHS0354_031113 [Potamilus streckersoni]|uniref:Uncharacterized protein n=1 Tax=Potamilus streckersoni TaxID=2493646 RepID=A0AAE0TBV6_9BIVA|nr:hypothetical protein CHS0354_031113 [Potamilus streckersoni]
MGNLQFYPFLHQQQVATSMGKQRRLYNRTPTTTESYTTPTIHRTRQPQTRYDHQQTTNRKNASPKQSWSTSQGTTTPEHHMRPSPRTRHHTTHLQRLPPLPSAANGTTQIPTADRSSPRIIKKIGIHHNNLQPLSEQVTATTRPQDQTKGGRKLNLPL